MRSGAPATGFPGLVIQDGGIDKQPGPVFSIVSSRDRHGEIGERLREGAENGFFLATQLEKGVLFHEDT